VQARQQEQRGQSLAHQYSLRSGHHTITTTIISAATVIATPGLSTIESRIIPAIAKNAITPDLTKLVASALGIAANFPENIERG
jgi:hypothetical protein